MLESEIVILSGRVRLDKHLTPFPASTVLVERIPTYIHTQPNKQKPWLDMEREGSDLKYHDSP